MKNMNNIISKVRSKYWTRTHKYGVRIHKSVNKAVSIDKVNCNTIWWEDIVQEMKNTTIYFELHEGNGKGLPT